MQYAEASTKLLDCKPSPKPKYVMPLYGNHLQAGDGFFVRLVTVPKVAMVNLAEPVRA